MRILMLNYEYPPLGGGAGNATYFLLKELSKYKDIKIDLVTSSIDEYREKNISSNIKIYFLNIGKKGNLHYQSNRNILNYSLKSFLFCKKLIKKDSYDLIHAFFGIPCGYVAMKLDLPYVVSLRGSDVPFYNERFYWLDKIFFKKMSKKIWKKSARVITNSEGLKKLAQKSYNIDMGIIYNGVDNNQFKPRKKDNGEFIIVSTSRLIARKGINYLLDAFIYFNKMHRDTRLILIGDGNQKDIIKNKVDNHGINDKVNILGSVDHKNIYDYYQKSDVFILPSLNEGMSNSLLEAMSSGLAIIATDTGGTKELVDKNNGLIIKKRNKKDIVSSLEYLYLNRNKLNLMKQASRKKALSLSWKKMAEKYIKIYKNIK